MVEPYEDKETSSLHGGQGVYECETDSIAYKSAL